MAEHHGRIVKVMGDGVIVEFGSAVNAVACAVELQKKMAVANDGIADDRRIVLRIGVNLGDVVVEGGDLYGDGVIIAVRLQAMAEPGGICLAGSVHEQIGNKLPLGFDDLGPCEVKNIGKPVRVFRAQTDPQRSEGAAMQQPVSAKPSIAVLPFTNMSGDPEQQFFSDGITEDIITELSRFRSLFVIARNSSFQYRDKAADTRRIARELGVQYVVEGSVRKMASRIRISAQLIAGPTGNHLWSERYDRDLQEIFDVQDEVVRTIAGTLEGRLSASIAEQARRKPTDSMAAYECLLQARQHFATFDLAAAEPLLKRAIELDASYAQAYSLLGSVYAVKFYFDMKPESLDRALAWTQKGVALDDSDAFCHAEISHVYLFRRQFELAGLHSQRAMVLNPSDPNNNTTHANWLARVGRLSEAIEHFDIALRHDPFPPGYYWETRSVALMAAKRYEDTIEAIRRMTRLFWWSHAYLAACHAQLGQIEQARAEAATVLQMFPDFTIARYMVQEPFKNRSDTEHVVESLRKAGLPE